MAGAIPPGFSGRQSSASAIGSSHPRVLFTRVKAVEIRFLDPQSRQWSNGWPVAAPTGPVTPANVNLLSNRPLAIEFTVVFEDWGRVLRLFEIPT